MMVLLWPETDYRTVLVIGDLRRYFDVEVTVTLPPPQMINLLVIDDPALDTLEMGDLAIAIPALLLSQSDERQSKLFIIRLGMGDLTQRPAGKADRSAGPSLLGIQLLADINYSLTYIGSRPALGFK